VIEAEDGIRLKVQQAQRDTGLSVLRNQNALLPFIPTVSAPPQSVRIIYMDTGAHLFSPLRLRDLILRNRIVVSPMCQYSSDDGFANDWHLVHLGSRAVGGAALVFTEAAAVLPKGRISPQDLGIWKDAQVEMLARIFHFIEAQGAVAGVQLAHAGRKASTGQPWKGGKPVSVPDGGWTPIFAPSALPVADGYQIPQELNQAQITEIVHAFANGAQRALQAGAKVIEIHAAHGYLLQSFLSPLSNHRTDEYGGSFDNRTRFLCETIAAVRDVWPEKSPLFVRISSTDWTAGGWTEDDSVTLACKLKRLGVDLIDCSSGGTVRGAKIPVGPGYQVPFAARIRREAAIATGAVGMITSPEQADQIVRLGQADLILMAREFLRRPYWPLDAGSALQQPVVPPPQYQRAFQ
jgi:2,4-dienoyl-CoA reductase-like NADH-dependent reductase (Old Yellow Enzyme family)